MGIQIPTRVRFMNRSEYALVKRVMGNTLPWRRQIIMTNGAGESGRAFTIPISFASAVFGSAIAPLLAPIILAQSYLTSVVNAGFLMNVGTHYNDMSVHNPTLLVHETMHAWQGHNSLFAQSYVYNSAINQCISGGSAYNFTPGQNWHSYNVEQQASIVEKWFANGESTTDVLFPYVRDYVRQGKA
jgi:hypothetical protein